jgi:hypothetical protein
VAAGIKARRSKEELPRSITLEKYSRCTGYPDQVPQIVGSACDNLTRYR